MSKSIRWGVLGFLIALALLCYLAGSLTSSVVFIIAGVIFEGVFWFRLIKTSEGKSLF